MVQITNLNQKLNTKDKIAYEGKNPEEGLLGPNRVGLGDLRKPNPMYAKYLDENPKFENFGRQMFEDPAAENARNFLISRTGNFGNSFQEGNNEFANIFVQKYTQDRIIPPDQKVDPRNLAQLTQSDAASGNAIVDGNVAGKFPSNSVEV